MQVRPDPLPSAPDTTIDATKGAGEYIAPEPSETAMDGSPARRPGDPDPAPASDGAPIFSTDPLAD